MKERQYIEVTDTEYMLKFFKLLLGLYPILSSIWLYYLCSTTQSIAVAPFLIILSVPNIITGMYVLFDDRLRTEKIERVYIKKEKVEE